MNHTNEPPTTASGSAAPWAARALVAGLRLDHGKHVRHVLDIGNYCRDIGFTDDSWWCDVPARYPIALWDTRRAARRVYPFAFMTTDERRTYRRQRPPAVPENIDPPEDETARMFGAPCPVRSGEEVTYDHAEHSGHGYILRVISIDGIAVCEVAGDDQRRVLVPPWRVTPVDPKPEFKTFTGQMNTLVATQCRRATCTLRKRHRSADKLFGRMTEEFASFARAVADGEPRVAIMEWSRKIKELQHKINEYSEYRDLVIEFALLTEDDAHRILTTPPQPSRAATSNTARRQRKTRHAT